MRTTYLYTMSIIDKFYVLGISEASPLHQYNLSGDIGDDEVFMVSNL